MLNRFRAGIFLQIRLCNIGAQTATVMDEDMIPWLLARWLGFIGKIPTVTSYAAQIACDDDAAVTIKAMPHKNSEFVVSGRSGITFNICKTY